MPGAPVNVSRIHGRAGTERPLTAGRPSQWPSWPYR